MHGRRLLCLAAGALLVAACSDNGTQPSLGAPGLTVQLEGSASDTVRSLATRMTAIVNDSTGRPRSGATVTFRLETPDQKNIAGVSPVGAGAFGLTSLTATTDASGRASADLMHLIEAGTTRIIIEVPSQTGVLADTIAVTTTPGAPAEILLSPRDTALYQGGTAIVAAVVADHFGNARPETVTLSAGTGGVTISGTTITATAGPSRQVVRAQYNALHDSLYISIVPHGVIAARGRGAFEFTTMELDGSAQTPIVLPNPSPFTVPEAWTEWTSDGSGLLYYVNDSNNRDVMYRTPLDGGAPTPVLASSPMRSDVWPQASLDGSWIYFSSLGGTNESYVYRTHPDGSGVELLSLPGAANTNDIFPSPSPDNTKVVYATTRDGGSMDDPHLQVLDIASGTVTNLGRGTMPRWSPDGQWIGFIRGGGLMLVHPDGTGERELSPPAAGYEGETSWSPDSKWIIARRNLGIFDLFEVSTGVRLPLQYSAVYLQAPDWRPF